MAKTNVLSCSIEGTYTLVNIPSHILVLPNIHYVVHYVRVLLIGTTMEMFAMYGSVVGIVL